MTVIAGINLFDGVMLIADTRVTVSRPGHPDRYCDLAQKIFPLSSQLAVAFSGDVSLASVLIQGMIEGFRKRSRKDPISTIRWLPRFLKHAYANFEKSHVGRKGIRREISFLVAATLTDRPTIVEREKVAGFVKAIVSGESPVQRNSISGAVMRVLMAPAEMTHVPLHGTTRGMLGSMSSPNFEIKFSNSLNFHAIGSGGGAITEISRYADWILAGEPTNDLSESFALREAVSQFVASARIDTVGGMYPVVKIDGRGVGLLGAVTTYPKYTISLSAHPKTKRWLQENRTTGKQQALLYPWEINAAALTSDQKFDDWWEAVVDCNPSRGYAGRAP